MDYLTTFRRLRDEMGEAEYAEASVLEQGPVLEARSDWLAVKLHSRLLGLDLWLARDLEAAESIWSETQLPAFTLSEVPRFKNTPPELLAAVCRVRAEFGPTGSRWAT